MATNRLGDSGHHNYAASGTVTAGTPLLITSRVIIPKKSGVSGDTISCWTRGRFSGVAKQTNAPWAVGTQIYWNNSTSKFTTVVTGNTAAGFATAASTTGEATGSIDLNG